MLARATLSGHARSVFERFAPANIEEANSLIGEIDTSLLGLILDFKHPAFSEEDEWRLIVIEHKDPPHEARVKRRVTGADEVRYIEVPFDIQSISRIIIGPGGTQESNASMVSELLQSVGCSTARVEESRIPLR